MYKEKEIREKVNNSISCTKKIDEVDIDKDNNIANVYLKPIGSNGIGLLEKETDNLHNKDFRIKGIYINRVKLEREL